MPDHVLTPEEIAALLSAGEAVPAGAQTPSCTVDGEFPAAFSAGSPGWLALEALLESAAREFALALCPLMRERVKVVAARLEEATWSGAAPRGRQACLAMVGQAFRLPEGGDSLSQQMGRPHRIRCLAIVFNLDILATLLGRLLGSREPLRLSAERGLTPIEERLVGRLGSAFLVELARLSAGLWNCALERVVDLADLDKTSGVRMKCAVEVGVARGEIEVIVSGESAPALAALLIAKSPAPAKAVEATAQTNADERLVTLSLPTIELALPDGVSLEVGDVIDTELDTQARWTIAVDGKPCFEGTPGQWEGRLAVPIEEVRIEEGPSTE